MFTYPKSYDVIVVGAGHAGIEAAAASARLGCVTLLLTQSLDSIGQMSCNPAIGGQAKGQIVREIDALGGVMGLNTDATCIQFRMLNSSKGPSVRSPRAQCDKKAYQLRAKAELERHENLNVKQANVTKILAGSGAGFSILGSFGIEFRCKALVITAGTFMQGILHIGFETHGGGRLGDTVSTISDSLKELGFDVHRFKTGTPCRIAGRSIDFNRCIRQDGDQESGMFTFLPERLQKHPHNIFSLNHWKDGLFHMEQLPCWITHTKPETHEIIRSNLDRSPLYAKRIEGVGPRYCPSIEDKVVKFAEKSGHQIFLEPEGRHTEEYYVNGVSTSLPLDVQYAFMRTIPGLENVEIMRPGYAVEYDFMPPTQLHHTLETKRIPNLYFAGQINGTSGYEEAAAQGLVAGANAALKVLGRSPLVLDRADAYIGVLIDDLVTKGVEEPYRMFTSRAEHRLVLRHDNADQRLTPIGHACGLVDAERWAAFQKKQTALEELRRHADSGSFEGLRISTWLRRPENSAFKLGTELRGPFSLELWASLEIDIKYQGYIDRQNVAIERLRCQEERRLPCSVDYTAIHGLRAEARQKLAAIQPRTLGHAARISGVTPADIALLSVWMERKGARLTGE
jgi:tRNA uridine 5-carboxymethylaminomethyl modification enzyme